MHLGTPARILGGAALLAVLITGTGVLLSDPSGPFAGLLVDPDPSRPNIVLVSLEPFRADHIPCYGYDRDTAPNICGLARNGTLFENAIAPAPWTLPSQASVHTGTYMPTHDVRRINDTLPVEAVTIAEALRVSGYTTRAFVSGGDLSARYGFDAGFDRYRIQGQMDRFPVTARWLRHDADEPFFLFIQSFTTHSPYSAPPQFRETYTGNYSGPLYNMTVEMPNGTRVGFTSSAIGRENGTPVLRKGNITIELTEDDVQYVRDVYDGAVRYVDDRLGEIFTVLELTGLANDTVVIVTAAHGENLGDHRIDDQIFGHGFPYEHTIRVPLVAAGPGIDRGNVAGQVQLVDLMPTILDLADARTNVTRSQVEGESLVPALRGNGAAVTDRYAFSFKPQMIRTNTWKYVDSREPRLYRIGNSSEEERNLLKKRPRIVQRLRRQLADFLVRLLADGGKDT